jgi:hypothetical protein
MGLQDRDYYQARQQKTQRQNANNNNLSAYTKHFQKPPRLKAKLILIWIGITIVLTIVANIWIDAKYRSTNTLKPALDKREIMRPKPKDERRYNQSTWTI